MAIAENAQALAAEQARQLEQAFAELSAGRIAEATALARGLVQAAPRSPDAHHALALCLGAANEFAAADQVFETALGLAPRHPMILVNQGATLRRAGRLEEAIRAFGAAAAAAPNFAKAWIELAAAMVASGKPGPAVPAAERGLALMPDASLGWHVLGSAQRALGEFEAAEAAFRRVVELEPGNGQGWINLGGVVRMCGRAEQAVACYARAEAAGANGPELQDARAGALLDAGDPARALAQAQQLNRSHPDFVPGYGTLAHLLWEHGAAFAPDVDPAAHFRTGLEAQPGNSALRLSYSQFLMAAKQPEAALEQVRRLRTDGDHPVYVSLEATALEVLGRSDEAGKLYAQAFKVLGDRDPAFLKVYARHLLRAGQWDHAARMAEASTALAPTSQEAWAYLATAWRLLEDPREHWLCAYDHLVDLVEVEPPPGYEGLDDYLAALLATLETLHQARREPMMQTLRGGSQTPGRLFGRPEPVLAEAEATIAWAVERWLARLPQDDKHPFLSRRAASLRFSGSWSVRLWSSGSHVNHIHPEGWISSAYYVSLPPSVRQPTQADGDAGCIQFGQPPVELGLDLAPRRVIRPIRGRLALFPSYVWHGTVPFQDEQPRVTIAFDVSPRALAR
jgi:tetratricopeptide (TPR) repeat protein